MSSGKDLAFIIASREMSCKSRFDGDNAMRILVVVKVIGKIKAFLVEWKESKQPLDYGENETMKCFSNNKKLCDAVNVSQCSY